MSNLDPETGSFFPRDRSWQPKAYTPDYKTSVVRSPRWMEPFQTASEGPSPPDSCSVFAFPSRPRSKR